MLCILDLTVRRPAARAALCLGETGARASDCRYPDADASASNRGPPNSKKTAQATARFPSTDQVVVCSNQDS